jgi:hypothetical protein
MRTAKRAIRGQDHSIGLRTGEAAAHDAFTPENSQIDTELVITFVTNCNKILK